MNPKEKILLQAAVIWSFADGMFGPLFSVFSEKIGGNVLDITWAWSVYLLVTGICVVIVGRYSDRHDKLKLLVCGYGLSSVFTFAYIFVETSFQLMCVQAGLGLALALSNPTWSALYAQYAPKKTSGSMWGYSDGAAKIATAGAIFIGGYVVQVFSFQALFMIMGCLFAWATVYQASMAWK
jgi:MFS family permease